MSAPGWKKTLITATPFRDCDSMCSMLSTSVVSARSTGEVTRCAMSSAEKPLNDQTMLSTGMSMLGKISVGVRSTLKGPMMKINSATTMTYSGRRKASFDDPHWTDCSRSTDPSLNWRPD